jgi:hypothetical protein
MHTLNLQRDSKNKLTRVKAVFKVLNVPFVEDKSSYTS